MNADIVNFRMPRYKEIPNVGLYLEQTIKYINEALKPLEVMITPSMLSNYVKQGYVNRPIKKQYYADQIACLIFIALAKQVLSMDNIKALFKLQEQTDSLDDAYDLFCDELEQMLGYIFGEVNKKFEFEIDSNETFEVKTLRSVVIAISHIIYLSQCFKVLENDEI